MPLVRQQGRSIWRGPARGPRRTFAASLAAFALLFQSFLPLLHHPATGLPGNGLLAGLIVICSPGGFRTISIQDQGDRNQAPDPQKPPSKSPLCPICLSAQIASVALVTPPVDLQPPSFAAIKTPLPTASLSGNARNHSPHSPRAPPILS